MVQAGREVRTQLLMLSEDVFRHFLKRGEVCGCISISKRVIGDEVEAVLEKVTKVGVIGGHGKKGRTGLGGQSS